MPLSKVSPVVTGGSSGAVAAEPVDDSQVTKAYGLDPNGPQRLAADEAARLKQKEASASGPRGQRKSVTDMLGEGVGRLGRGAMAAFGTGGRPAALEGQSFERLMQVTTTATNASNEDAGFREIVKGGRQVLNADAVSLYRLSVTEANLTLIYTCKTADDVTAPGTRSKVGQGIAGAVARSGQSTMAHDATGVDKRDDGALIYSVIACPLKSPQGKVIGVLQAELSTNPKRKFSSADEQSIRILSLSAAHVMYTSQMFGVASEHRNELIRASEHFDSGAGSENVSVSSPEGGHRPHGGRMSVHGDVDKNKSMPLSHPWQDWSFDPGGLSAQEEKMLIVDIFEEFGLFSRYMIDVACFMRFLTEIEAGYLDNPYHTFHHAIDVTHVCSLLISTCGADEFLESFQILGIFTAALAHDVGHDGFNNAFHASTTSELAITYNSVSILENYSSAHLFRVLQKQECNFFTLSKDQMTKMRGCLIQLILDTDAKHHFVLMTRFKSGFDKGEMNRNLISSLLLHSADVSNPARIFNIACKWAFAVQEEFFVQGDQEKDLNLPISPFMDRKNENLPRMQHAFINAVVDPLFSLLSELLPKVEEHCCDQLRLNREIWDQYLKSHIITKEEILLSSHPSTPGGSRLESLRSMQNSKESPLGAAMGGSFAPGGLTPSAPKAGGRMTIMSTRRSSKSPPTSVAPGGQRVARRSLSIFGGKGVEPKGDAADEEDYSMLIPGIPMAAEKPTEYVQKIEERSDDGDDEEPAPVVHWAIRAKKWLIEFLDHPAIQFFLLVATIFALFGDDINKSGYPKSHDPYVSIASFVCLCAFVIELIISAFVVDGYMQFFFWLDLIAAASMLPDIDFIFGPSTVCATASCDEGGNTEEGAGLGGLARAGRAAKAGARAGRIARMLRLLRLVRAVKMMKWAQKQAAQIAKRKGQRIEAAPDELEMSVVGRKMTELITRKVIIAIMLMLLVFSVLTSNYTPDSRAYGLKQMMRDEFQVGGVPSAGPLDAVVDYYKKKHPELIKLELIFASNPAANIDQEIINQEQRDLLRSTEVERFEFIDIYNVLGNSAVAEFNISEQTASESVVSIWLTLVVCVLLAGISLAFSRDAQKYMIGPIERMQSTVQKIAKNPLGHLTEFMDEANDSRDETHLIQHTLVKMARLLQVGFGAAGAEIIGKNMQSGDIDPMVPGRKVDAAYGFCDIRDFTKVTEILQEGVMIFVNQVAEVVHKCVDESGGAPNKNIGDAFFIVWKLDDVGANEGVRFDAALMASVQVQHELDAIGDSSFFHAKSGDTSPSDVIRERLPDYKIKVGFGLHCGWAIEGAIGSSIKVDASYLSPHVNLTARLETATKQYGVSPLMSSMFFERLTPQSQARCRRVDRAMYIGVAEPLVTYMYDERKLNDLFAKAPTIKPVASADNAERELALIGKLQSGKTVNIRSVYDTAFDAYISGAWPRAQVALELWRQAIPADGPANFLYEYMSGMEWKAPPGWVGCHVLTEK